MNERSLTLLHQQPVLSEWIDYNRHMNVAYYVLIFDQSLDVFLDDIGLTREYRDSSNCTVYVLETHVTYIQAVSASMTGKPYNSVFGLPMPGFLQSKLEERKREFASVPFPKQSGAVIGIRRKK